jgi:Flp pilus assembly protein TadD
MTPVVQLSADLQTAGVVDATSADRCRQSAIALQKEGRVDEAIALYRQGLALDPRDASGYRCLGTAYKQQRQFDRAVVCFRHALALSPAFPEAWNNLGNTLLEHGDASGAAEAFARACRLRPEFAGGHFNHALALAALGQFDAAIAAGRRACDAAPQNPDFRNGLGLLLFDGQRVDDAIAAFEQSLAIQPECVAARYNRGLAWLTRGDFARGWSEYEWRWKLPNISHAPHRQPRWDGSPSANSTILLDAEQGLGDTIQFARYAPLVKARVGRVILRVQKPVVKLLRSLAGVDQVVAQDETLPTFDAWLPFLSVPALFTPTVDSIPRTVPYLRVDDSLVQFWRERLAGISGWRVGIHWQGNPNFPKDRFRSLPVTCFEPVARIPGVQLISLQKGAGTEQLRQSSLTFPVVDLGLTLDEIHGPFLDTAAILKCLDLVVTSDSSLAHLAGALGIETWLAVPHIPEWRWLLDRDDTPWYPTLHLVRQSRVGQWADVFERIALAVGKRLAALPQKN